MHDWYLPTFSMRALPARPVPKVALVQRAVQ